MTDTYEKASNAAEFIKKLYPSGYESPKVAIICGTGLGGIANILDSSSVVEIPYKDIPGFMVSTGKCESSCWLSLF